MKRGIKHLLLACFCLVTINNTFAQEYFGFLQDNWAGINAIDLNPSLIQDNRYKFDMNLVGFDVDVYNNYIGVRRQLIRDLRNDAFNEDDDFRDTYLIENQNSDRKFLDVSTTVQGPGFMFNIGRKNSLAFTSKVHAKVQMTDLSPDLAKLAWEELDYPLLWQTNLDNENFSLQAMSWSEYGIAYGREIFDMGNHYLKGGIRLKLLQGHGAAYIYADNLRYNFKNDDTLSIFNTNVSYGHSDNLIYENDEFSYKHEFISNPTVGVDFGFTYEWRPNHGDYTYDMNGETGLYRRDKNKYKLKLGFAVNDIGRLRYQKDPRSADFNADIEDWDITNLGIEDLETFDQLITDTYGQDVNDDGEFLMQLPTTMVLNADYNIWKGFYVSLTPYIALQRRNNANKIANHSVIMLSPRFEHKWVGVGLPYTYNTFGSGTHQLGFYLRMGPLYIGSSDFLALGFKEDMYAANVYAGLKVPVPFGKPKDKDGDLVSNRKDDCKKKPGTWENMGCPDSDGDGLLDNEDDCPEEFGPVDNQGCPWPDTDEDGIADKEDECPEEAGPVENNGCPVAEIDTLSDLDEDGILDVDDKCPEEFGPAENDGCPYGDRDEDGTSDEFDNCPDTPGAIDNGGCPWSDTDGDGLLDNVDRCPKTPGPESNDGCPELKEEEKQIMEEAFNNLEFESGRAVIKASSYKDLDKIVDILESRPGAVLKIEGHTDATGGDALNMQLSKERALAVKQRLVEKGIASDRFFVNWYGETRPIADNNTPEGRKANRRVELQIMFE